MKNAYVFRGAPASGKSTLVPQFAEKLGGKVARIEHDMFLWSFHLIGRTLEEVSDDERRFAFQNMLLVLEAYCKRGEYQLVIDGLFTWNNPASPEGCVQDIIKLLERFGFAHRSFVLKADKPTLRRRNKVRAYTVALDEFERLYGGVYDQVGPEETMIDSTGLTPQETLLLLK